MDPTISPSCATWLSMSCERTTPSLPCVESSSSQAGMTNTWPSLSLNFEMRLPWVSPRDYGEHSLALGWHASYSVLRGYGFNLRLCSGRWKKLKLPDSILFQLSGRSKPDLAITTRNFRCGSKAGIVEHDAGGLGYSRSSPDSRPVLAGAGHGSDGPIGDTGRAENGQGFSQESSFRESTGWQ